MNRSTVGHSLDVALPCPMCGDIDGCHHPEAADNARRIEDERPLAGLIALALAAAAVGVIVLVLG